MLIFCIRFVRFILAERKDFVLKLPSKFKFRFLTHKSYIKLKYWYKKAEQKKPSKLAIFFIRLVSRITTTFIKNLVKIKEVNSKSILVLVLHAINFAGSPWVKHKNSSRVTLSTLSQDYFSKRSY
jgi:hypothetical protein